MGKGPFTPEILAARRAIAPPLQITCPKGGIFVRDVRVWHRGMPNKSGAPRHMLGLGFNSATDPKADAATRESNNGRRTMVFSESARAAFAAPNPYDIERENIAFVDGPCDPWGNKEGEVIGPVVQVRC